MRLGLVLNYSDSDFASQVALVKEAEVLGYSSAWTSEVYGSDALTPAAWLLAQTNTLTVGTACMQMPARTPACAAMSAMTLQTLSGGRFVMGIGPSGPQVVEGWHGVAYGKPLIRTREYIAIVRSIVAREEPVTHEGEHYQLPYQGPGASGLGKPLKSLLRCPAGLRIFTGSISTGGIRTAAEVADGIFPLFMNPDDFSPYDAPLREGFAKAGGGKGLADFGIAPFVMVIPGADLNACRMPVKQFLALYVGGMGARDKNFYKEYVTRIGYGDAAQQIQDLFLGGKKMEAVMAVPDALVDAISLVGPRARIKERLGAWKAAAERGHVTTLLASGASPEALRLLAEEAL